MSDTGEDGPLRLFIALELPEPTRRGLTERATAELSGIEGIRLLAPEALHLTLCFLGATPAPELDPICAACRQAIAGHPPVELSLGRAVALPRRGPRVVAMRIGGRGAVQLAELQGAVSARMAAGGWYRPESRAFLAHVTLARVRPRSRIDGQVVAMLPAMDEAPFVADTVTLFRSDTRPDSARYKPLARLSLNG